jgi:HD-GYP domain-containing protein (c-di-GMP phosphodiesterase class II)
MNEDGQDELARDIRETVKELIDSISIQNGQNTSDSHYIFVIITVILIVIAVIFAVMMVQIFVNSREQKIQKQRFKATMDMIKDIHMAKTQVQVAAMSEAPQMPENDLIDFEELQELAAKCEKLGEKIDRHTDRQNNSKSVSELVFKVSTALGVDNKLSTVYFCASMVYDSGFLDLPQELFFSEILSSAERKLMRTHVMRYSEFLDFIPRKYYGIFSEAASLHHENMNGSGYPEGLSGSEIPQLPRILHAVESYVSLVNRRSYHNILSKKDAIAELRRQSGIYDMDIIDILETLI